MVTLLCAFNINNEQHTSSLGPGDTPASLFLRYVAGFGKGDGACFFFGMGLSGVEDGAWAVPKSATHDNSDTLATFTRALDCRGKASCHSALSTVIEPLRLWCSIPRPGLYWSWFVTLHRWGLWRVAGRTHPGVSTSRRLAVTCYTRAI